MTWDGIELEVFGMAEFDEGLEQIAIAGKVNAGELNRSWCKMSWGNSNSCRSDY